MSGGERPQRRSETGHSSAEPTDVATLTDRAAQAEEFKAAMRMLPCGVVIVTTEVDGRPWGLTVSAFCSISPYPPKVLVSLARHTRTRAAILETGVFGIDVLSASQRGLAELCAAPGMEKWIDEFCERRGAGLRTPAIANALCHLDCDIDTVTEVSDHSLVIGRVEGTRVVGDVGEGSAGPLLYFDREFRGLGERLGGGTPARRQDPSRTGQGDLPASGRVTTRSVAIVGAGQAGLQLGFGLLERGYDVTVYSDRTPAELLESRAPPTAAMFGSALSHERELGLNLWDDDPGWFHNIHMSFSEHPGELMFGLEGRLDQPGHAVDQRLKFSRWMNELEARGGGLRLHAASVGDLEELACDVDLVVVATGRGEMAALFDVDDERSIHLAPQRSLCLFVLDEPGAERVSGRRMSFDFVADQGEVLWIPFLDKHHRACRSVLVEARPGRAFDRFSDLDNGERALEVLRELVDEYCPWQLDDLGDSKLTEPRAWARGRLAPTVRNPVGHLPSGRVVMPIGDAAVLNDPIGSQGANAASKMARFVTERIIEHRDRPFGADWMEGIMEEYWEQEGQYVTRFTEMLLEPFDSPAHQVMLAGSKDEAIANWFINGFNEPHALWPALGSSDMARRFLSEQGSES